MKEIFLILTHVSDKIQENQLRNLVYKLKENNKTVFIATHSYITEDIIKMCDYYLYDSDNHLVPNYKTSGNWFYGCKDFVVETWFNTFNYYNYSVPYSKSLYNGLSLSKQSEYDIAHILVYDTDFTSLDEFNSNNEILKEYDCVSYSIKGDMTQHIGHFVSFNLNNYSLEEFTFNKSKLINELETLENGFMVEKSTYYNLLKPKKHFIKTEENIDTSKLILNLSDSHPNHSYRISMNCVCKDINSEDTFWFMNNESLSDLNLFLLINNNKFEHFLVKSDHWVNKKIKNLSEINNLKFFKDNVLIQEIDFINNVDKEEFKIKSKFWCQNHS